MARRSLRPHLNQIRAWVRQGRTDAWIAHQLEVTVQQVAAFKEEQDLEATDGSEPLGPDFDDEVDLRAEDDALIAAELAEAEARAAREREETEARERAEAEARAARERADAEARGTRVDEEAEAESDEDEISGDDGEPRRRRSRRGGRGRRRRALALEGTFDHGEEGYGLWLDPAIQDDPVYAEHWAGHRPVTVTVEEDQIVIRRAGGDEDDNGA